MKPGEEPAKPVSASRMELAEVMMPHQANLLGKVFGGVILSYIDQAGAIGAKREVRLAGGGSPFLVTVAMNRVEFHQPVLVGDVVRFLTRKARLGRTSITMQVTVEVDRDAEVHLPVNPLAQSVVA